MWLRLFLCNSSVISSKWFIKLNDASFPYTGCCIWQCWSSLQLVHLSKFTRHSWNEDCHFSGWLEPGYVGRFMQYNTLSSLTRATCGLNYYGRSELHSPLQINVPVSLINHHHLFELNSHQTISDIPHLTRPFRLFLSCDLYHTNGSQSCCYSTSFSLWYHLNEIFLLSMDEYSIILSWTTTRNLPIRHLLSDTDRMTQIRTSIFFGSTLFF